MPDARYLTSEVPLTLQNSHYSVADSVPYLSNVVNVACLHCRAPLRITSDLEAFLQRGNLFVLFIYYYFFFNSIIIPCFVTLLYNIYNLPDKYFRTTIKPPKGTHKSTLNKYKPLLYKRSPPWIFAKLKTDVVAREN